MSFDIADLRSDLLFPNWKLKQGESDITIFKSIIEGIKDGQKTRYTIDMFDKYVFT